MKTVPIKARDDGKAPALPRSATRSGAVFTPFPPGCDQKGRARRCKALPGSTPAAFCALRTALLTHNAPPENRVNTPLAYFSAVDRKDLEATLLFFTPDAVFTIATYNTVYTGRDTEVSGMFERLFARYEKIWHGDFHHVLQLPHSIATRFKVANENPGQPAIHKNNCNFFRARGDLFDEVFVYMSGDNALR